MAFENSTTDKLKKYKTILLVSSIIGLGIMCFLLGIGLYQSTHDLGYNFIFIVPIICPLVILLGIFSGVIDKELKRRDQ